MSEPFDVYAWRRTERARLLARREAIDPGDRHAWNERITALLVECFPLLGGLRVGFCWPYRGEPDPRFALHRFRLAGARAALPVVIEKKGPLEFREWAPGTRTTPGVFGLPVPEGTAVVTPEAILIPPVGFDAGGYRLGYGGGYFDRTLAALAPDPLKVAVAFEASRIETIHPQWHDVPMDFVVTEAGVHPVSAGGLGPVEAPSRVPALAAALRDARVNR